MISEPPAPDERQVYLGLAWQTHEDVLPAGLLKLLRQGVVESGEFAYGRRYLGRPDAVGINPDWLGLGRLAQAREAALSQGADTALASRLADFIARRQRDIH